MMQSNLFRAVFISLIILLPGCARQWKPDAGYASLFNGHDLTGWNYNAQEKFDGKLETSDGRYSAQDGALVVHPLNPAKGPHLRQLWTTATFPTDFILKLEFRAGVNADSGIFIRKPQLQCRDYLVAGPYKALKHYKPQDWNTVVVTVKGNVARCECNGEVLEADRGQMEYRHIEIKEIK